MRAAIDAVTPPRQIYVAAGSRRDRAWGRRPRHTPVAMWIVAAAGACAAIAVLLGHAPV